MTQQDEDDSDLFPPEDFDPDVVNYCLYLIGAAAGSPSFSPSYSTCCNDDSATTEHVSVTQVSDSRHGSP